jgi:hypothetical protein
MGDLTLVQDRCWICGADVLPEDNFCRKCGVELRRREVGGSEKLPRATRRWPVGVFLAAFGGIVSVVSYLTGLIPLLAFGLGSLLIGFMVLYLPESESVGGVVATNLLLPPLLNVENLLEDLDLDQHGIYIPVRGLGVSPKVFVPLALTIATKNPPIGLTSSKRVFVTVGKNPEDRGVLLDAPGSQILVALEQSLRVDLARVQLDGLEDSLNSGLETLGIGKVTGLIQEDNAAQVEMQLTGLLDFEVKLRDMAPRVVAQVGTPMASIVAAAFSKATGKYVTIRTAALDQTKGRLRVTLKLGETPA